MKSSLQLQLFPDRFVTWETLTNQSRQSIREVLSQLVEQAVGRQQFEAQSQASETEQPYEQNHV